jgi:predicted nucleic acid-binding protein
VSARRNLVLDAGALINVENDPRGRVFALCRAGLREGQRPLLPAVVLGQVWRASPRQHAVGVLRRMCQVLPFTEQTAEDVGRLLAQSGSSDVVDAAVVVAAIEHGAVVLTSDPGDIDKLADAAGYRLPLLTV